MPTTPTYPGVYIEEIPSGVRTIMGVATSITAFIGRTVRGPVNEAVTINSFGDYERIFGGLWTESTMSYAVRDFYMNGGSQAIIVRLFHPYFADDTKRSEALVLATAQAQTAADAVSKAASDSITPTITPIEVADAAEAKVATAGAPGEAALLAATAVAQAARVAVKATPLDVADAADEARIVELAIATIQAQTAADAVSKAASDSITPATTPEEVADAAEAEATTAGAAGAAALMAATAVAKAARDAVTLTATAEDVADAADAARSVAVTAVTAQAHAAADAVSKAASDAVAAAKTPEKVADAAEAKVATAGAAGAVALLVATAVAQAARDAVIPTAQDVADAADAAISGAVSTAAAKVAPMTKARLALDVLNLEAANEGIWGNSLRVRIDHDVKGLDAANLFNISIKDTSTGQIEVIRNVSVLTTNTRRIDRVLEQESKLIRVAGTMPVSRPVNNLPNPIGVVTGKDPFETSTSTGVTTGIASDGSVLDTTDYLGSINNKQGIYALEKADLFNILCIPPYTPETDVGDTLWGTAAKYCESRRSMLIIDSPVGWNSKDNAKGDGLNSGVAALGTNSKNACVFFPRLRQPNPKKEYQVEDFASCGAVAGIFSRTDSQRGVWKAPAGLDATLVGVPQLSVSLTDAENGELNPLGINCLRIMPAAGRIVWGSRTLQGDDRLASEWKYVPVRRTALYIEESLYRGTQWVVFEPNDEPLWGQIRLNLGAFMHSMFRQGAFQGKTPKEAYFVKCDRETTTQDDINRGIVNIIVGFAPLKPAEFVILKIQQIAGQIQT